jgi:uncharacterized metal-binding protein YceD (DUF177 family)
MSASDGEHEFSRIIRIEPEMGSGDDAITFSVEASEDERAALARRFGLLALDALSAVGRIDVTSRGRRARMTATLKADATQVCVVSLEPVRAMIEEQLSVTYDRYADRTRIEPAQDFDIDTEDPPDPLPDDGIDVGEAVAEHFGLALDPYPRAPGVAIDAPEVGGERAEPGETSPFSVLDRLKGR